MKECSKSIPRRLSDPNFTNKYFVGVGLDIGGKPDPLGLYAELFIGLKSVITYDREDGDAQHLEGVPDNSFDFVHSSHCLEHLSDPAEGLQNWFRVVRPGGHLVLLVPDEDLYEQGVFPSTNNRDHKWTFAIYKQSSWSSHSVNLITLATQLGPLAEIVKVELLNSTYRYSLPRYDQTLTPIGECSIELVLRKRFTDEIEFGGLRARDGPQPNRDMKIHLNQYRDDMATLKSSNVTRPPFENEDDL